MNFEINNNWDRIPQYRKILYGRLGLDATNWHNPMLSSAFAAVSEKSWNDKINNEGHVIQSGLTYQESDILDDLGFDEDRWDNYELTANGDTFLLVPKEQE